MHGGNGLRGLARVAARAWHPMATTAGSEFEVAAAAVRKAILNVRTRMDAAGLQAKVIPRKYM